MRELVVFLMLVALAIALFGCGGHEDAEIETAAEPGGAEGTDQAATARTLEIEWQRLVDDDGKTCDRCGATQHEVQEAYGKLKASLAVLDIDVVLEERPMTPAECAKDISQSNRIWIAGKSLEEWLDAEVGMSPCGGCCEDEFGGSVECRTVIYGGQTYEAIPSELIIDAGLLAAANLRSADPCGGCAVDCMPGEACCPGALKGTETCADKCSGGE